MTLLSYEIFQTVIEQGSFARAAGVLHLTPSAISHSISAMEEEVGCALFVRGKNGVKLTGAGQQLYPYIQKIIAGNNNLRQAIENLNGLSSGAVKLGCINTVCLTWIPRILPVFHEDYPQIDINIYQGSNTDNIDWIRNGSIDFGIISQAAAEGLPFLPLYEDDLMCVVPKGYMPSYTQCMTPDDLKYQPFVIQQESCDKDITAFLNNYHLSVRANCHVLDDQSTMAMVECGAGICIMPELITRTVSCNVDIYPIQPRQYRVLGICCANMDLLSPAAREMVKYVKGYVGSGACRHQEK